MAAALREFEWALAASLDELVVPEQQAIPEVARVRQWRLPQADRDALIRYGLPVNDRGLAEADFRDSADDAYGLMALSGGSRIVAVADTGVVLCLPGPQTDMEQTAEFWERNPDFLAAIKKKYPDYPRIPPTFVNSSVALFVDTSWRFERVARALLKLPTGTAEPFEVECANELFDRLDVFLEHLRSADPQAVDSRYAYWPDVVEGW